jgi:hypothetical protein
MLKSAAILGIIDSLERNGIISSDAPEIEKVASFFYDSVDFDPTNPNDLQKVAVAFIDTLDKIAQVSKPDNTLSSDEAFSALLEKARTEREGVNKGRWGVGQSEMADKGLIGQLIAATRKDAPTGKDNTLESDDLFAALLEKARTERNGVNKGVRGVGQSEMADKGIIGQEVKKASDNINIDDLIAYLQK